MGNKSQPLLITVCARRGTSHNSLWPLLSFYHMLFNFSLFITSFPLPDLLGFGLILTKEQYPFAFMSCNSDIDTQSDLYHCKDVCFFIFLVTLFLFQAFILCFSFAWPHLHLTLFIYLFWVMHLWQIYYREKDLLFWGGACVMPLNAGIVEKKKQSQGCRPIMF